MPEPATKHGPGGLCHFGIHTTSVVLPLFYSVKVDSGGMIGLQKWAQSSSISDDCRVVIKVDWGDI